jgi:hypothetical protein
MYINTKILFNEIIQKENTSISPLVESFNSQKELELLKEQKLQEQVATIFKDKKYYKQFQEAAIAPTNVQPPTDTRMTALENKLNDIAKQLDNPAVLTPDKQKSLEERKLEIEAALQKVKIDSDERIAKEHLKKNTIGKGIATAAAGGLGGGIGMGLIPGAIEGLSKVNWGAVGGGLKTAGGFIGRTAMGLIR